MKKKTWKTGPFIQDLDKDKIFISDHHYRCEICNYSNMGHHDEDLIHLSGSKMDRQMFKSTETGQILCYNCTSKESSFGFNKMEDLFPKSNEWKALPRPNKNWTEDKPLFDKSAFYLEETASEYKDDEWDELEKYNAEMQEEYWEEILKQEGLEKID